LLPLSGEIREGLHLLSKTIVPKLLKDELFPPHNRQFGLISLREERGPMYQNQKMNLRLLQRTMKGIVGIAKCQSDLQGRSAPALTSRTEQRQPDDRTLLGGLRTGSLVHVSQCPREHMAMLPRKGKALMEVEGHPTALARAKGASSSSTKPVTILMEVTSGKVMKRELIGPRNQAVRGIPDGQRTYGEGQHLLH